MSLKRRPSKPTEKTYAPGPAKGGQITKVYLYDQSAGRPALSLPSDVFGLSFSEGLVRAYDLESIADSSLSVKGRFAGQGAEVSGSLTLIDRDGDGAAFVQSPQSYVCLVVETKAGRYAFDSSAFKLTYEERSEPGEIFKTLVKFEADATGVEFVACEDYAPELPEGAEFAYIGNNFDANTYLTLSAWVEYFGGAPIDFSTDSFPSASVSIVNGGFEGIVIPDIPAAVNLPTSGSFVIAAASVNEGGIARLDGDNAQLQVTASRTIAGARASDFSTTPAEETIARLSPPAAMPRTAVAVQFAFDGSVWRAEGIAFDGKSAMEVPETQATFTSAIDITAAGKVALLSSVSAFVLYRNKPDLNLAALAATLRYA